MKHPWDILTCRCRDCGTQMFGFDAAAPCRGSRDGSEVVAAVAEPYRDPFFGPTDAAAYAARPADTEPPA